MEEVDSDRKPIQLFLKASSSVVGPGDTIDLPRWEASVFHHEAELAVVIGRPTKDITTAQAHDHIFGYTCLIDVSARGALQRVGYGDKSLDTFGPLGPWIATADEVADPQDLGIRLWVDGEVRHDYRTNDMEHPIGELVAWAAQISTLEPGDVISCGVNHQGVGPLQDGETVEIEIERIGRMALRVSDPLGRSWPKGVDTEVAEFVRAKRLDPNVPPPAKLAVRGS
jgi:2-keto-4-pentenoate hydratase/2-oxohepta-3-ene-1,7-dioic acid hydratase in catechol pathway